MRFSDEFKNSWIYGAGQTIIAVAMVGFIILLTVLIFKSC